MNSEYGRVGIPHRLGSGAQQRLRPVHQQIRVADRDQVVIGDPQLGPQTRNLLVRGGEVARFRQDRLEFDEVAKVLDLVEVDPHALPQKQPPSLGHDDDSPERGVERLGELIRRRDGREHVSALGGFGVIRPPVRDQFATEGSGLGAQLEPSAPGRKYVSRCTQHAPVGGAEGQAARFGRLGVAIDALSTPR